MQIKQIIFYNNKTCVENQDYGNFLRMFVVFELLLVGSSAKIIDEQLLLLVKI